MTSPAMMTGVGMLVGTAAYMSPEQARGKPVDRRADIWAFGCVLYEMLTGKQAFDAGETVSDAVAAILKNEPDWNALPADTPTQIRTLLRRCLQKDPQKRLPHIGVARLEIDEGPVRDDTSHVTVPTAAHRRRLPWIVAGAGLVVATTMFAAAVAFIHFRETPPDFPVVRWTLLPPDNTTFNSDFSQGVGLPTLSPDGKRIVFGTRSADGAPLWVRSLDALTAQPLAGTDRARFPFWSPDSRFVAFFADGKLKKIEASGGPVLTVADAPNGRGGSWNRDGVIIFSPTTTDSPLLRVSSAGGTASRVSKEEGSFPWFLPDGQHFLYQGFDVPGGQPGIRVGALDGSPSTLVGRGSNVLYAQGHLLFVREGTLMAQPFDVDRLTTAGDAIPVAERVQNVLASGRAAAFSVSETGLLAYREGRAGGGYTLTWVDRSGTRGATIGAPHFTVGDIQFSPDRTRVAVAIQEGTNNDIWIYDVGRGLRTRFTSDPGNDTAPVWSPDGRTIIFRSNRKGHYDLYRKTVDSIATEELLYADELDKFPTSWSPDGKLLLYHAGRPQETDINLWMLPLTAERQNVAIKPSTLLATPFNEGLAQFSPDGRWILYVSDESKRNEVYLSPFLPPHGLGGKRQISVAGMLGVTGGIPRWRRDGREIFYVGPDRRLMSTEVSMAGERLNVGMTRPLFDMLTELRQAFEVSADGQRFLLLGTDDDKTPVPITLVQNWPASLKN
jgi:Tol biopolymer transport system component